MFFCKHAPLIIICFYYVSSKSPPNNTILVTRVQCEISIMNFLFLCLFCSPSPISGKTFANPGTGTEMDGCDWRFLSIIQRLLIHFFPKESFSHEDQIGWILTEKTIFKLKRGGGRVWCGDLENVSLVPVRNKSGLSWSCCSFLTKSFWPWLFLSCYLKGGMLWGRNILADKMNIFPTNACIP